MVFLSVGAACRARSWGFVLAFFALVPIRAAGISAEALAACRVLLGASGRGAPEDAVRALAEGQDVFEAAAKLIEEGTGKKLPDDGRSAGIPKEWIDPLTAEFMRVYRAELHASEQQGVKPGAPPIIVGNVGHMDDHLKYFEQFKGDFQRDLGVDPASLKLAVVAHDIGKAFVSEVMDRYIAHRTESNFLDRYVLSHEFHSIALIPKAVERVLKAQGVDTSSAKGQKAVIGVSLRIMEMIRLHNGVHVKESVEAMKARYPDLTTDEIQKVLDAWWPENYRGFAGRMGGLKLHYGGEPSGAIPVVLNLADRATLTAPTYPWKIGKQNIARFGFTSDLLTETFITAPTGNEVLVRAQASQLKPYLRTPSRSVYDLPPIKEAQENNRKALALGKHVLPMNAKAELPAGLAPKEMPMTAAERTRRLDEARKEILKARPELGEPAKKTELDREVAQAVPQYLYYRVGTTWHRVNGAEVTNGVTQKFDGGEWKTIKSSGHPVDHLMDLIVQDGRWKG